MLEYKDGDRVRLVSRNGVEHTRRFPEIAAAVASLRPRTLASACRDDGRRKFPSAKSKDRGPRRNYVEVRRHG